MTGWGNWVALLSIEISVRLLERGFFLRYTMLFGKCTLFSTHLALVTTENDLGRLKMGFSPSQIDHKTTEILSKYRRTYLATEKLRNSRSRTFL